MSDALAVRAVSVALCRNSADCRCLRRDPAPCVHAIARKGREAARLVRAFTPEGPALKLVALRTAEKALPATGVAKTTGLALLGPPAA
jgi:hypothetical protein